MKIPSTYLCVISHCVSDLSVDKIVYISMHALHTLEEVKKVLLFFFYYYYLFIVLLRLLIIYVYHISRDMTKPAKWLCAQRRLRSAQADQSLRCPHEESLGP